MENPKKPATMARTLDLVGLFVSASLLALAVWQREARAALFWSAVLSFCAALRAQPERPRHYWTLLLLGLALLAAAAMY